MFRRIIGLILVAAMLFSFPVFAEDTAVATSEEVVEINEVVADSGNIAFVKALGMMAISDNGAMPLTRGAFAKMFCAITRYDISLAGAAAVSFTDVPGELTAAVAEVANMGVMGGVSDTMFMPDSNVTYAQALKAIVTFLGYKDYAEVKGGFPYGYYIQAQELGLIKNAPSNINAEITYEKAAELFKLALNVSYRRPYEYSEDVAHEVVKNLTYLEYHRDIVRVNGLVDANSTVDISGRGVTEEGEIKIDGEVYTYNKKALDAAALIGQNVDAYYNVDTNELVYIEAGKTDIVVIDDYNIGEINEKNRLEYYTDDGKYKYLKLDDELRIIYNGKVLANYDYNVINPFAETHMDGNLTVIDNDNDGKYEIIIITAYETYVIDKIVNNVIYAKYREGIAIDLREQDIDAQGRLYNIVGDPLKVAALKAGRVISVTRALDGEIIEIIVTHDTYTGKLEGKKMIDGKLYLKVDGNLFETSNAVALNPYVENLVMGSPIKVIFNKEALVSDIDQRSVATLLDGYLTDHIYTEYGMDGAANYIRVFGSDKQWYTLKLAEKVSVNDAPATKIEDFLSVAGYVMKGSIVKRIKRQPIRYTLDEAGNVKKLYLANTTNTTAPFYMHENLDGEGESTAKLADGVTYKYPLYYGSRNMQGRYIVPTNVLVYSVPTEEERDDEDGYFVRDTGSSHLFKNAARKAFEGYGYTDRPVLDVMVFKGLEVNRVKSSSTSYSAVVAEAEAIIDDNGDMAYRIVAKSGANTYEYIDTEGMLLVAPGATLPDVGDIIKVYEGDGKILSVRYYYDASEERVYTGYAFDAPEDVAAAVDPSFTVSAWYGTNRYAKGTVTYYDGEILKILFRGIDNTEYEYVYRAAGFRLNRVRKEGRTTVVEQANLDDIIGENQGIGLGSTVVIQSYNYSNRLLVIYE